MAEKRPGTPPSPNRSNAQRGPAGRVTDGLNRVAELVVPSLVRAVDVEEVVERIDLDRAMASLDLNALAERVDMNAVVERVDIKEVVSRVDVDAVVKRVDIDDVVSRVDMNAALARVDLDALLRRLDLNALAQRIDLDALVARVDLDAALARVDLAAALQRVDVHDLAVRADLGNLVVSTTEDLATGTLDLLRRQCAGVDTVIGRVGTRIVRGDPDTLPPGPPNAAKPPAAEELPPGAPERGATPGAIRRAITGHYAGVFSRLIAFAVDVLLYLGSFALMTALVRYLVGLFTDATPGRGLLWLIGLVLWGFLYAYLSLTVAGRTLGMHLLGLRLLARDGSALSHRQALLHVVAFPLSFLILGLGFLGIIVGRERRALHDVIADTAMVYDWGSRPAELPAPMSRWLARRQAASVGQAGSG